MKKKTPYMDFYYEHMMLGSFYGEGLCGCFGCDKIELFKPTEQEYDAKNINWEAWAYDGYPTKGRDLLLSDVLHGFTPLRQTIVLFLAAMHEEL